MLARQDAPDRREAQIRDQQQADIDREVQQTTRQRPLLLAAADCVTTATRDAVAALGVSSRVVLGGTAVVSGAAASLTTC